MAQLGLIMPTMRIVFILLCLCYSASTAALEGASLEYSENSARRRMEVLLIAMTDSKPSIYQRAMNGLVRIGNRAVADLEILASDKEPVIRVRAADVLGRIGGKAAVALLLSMKDDDSAEVRAQVALAFGDARAVAAQPCLYAWLYDEDIAVRDSAALALALIGHADALEPLLAAFIQERGREARSPAEERSLKRSRKSMDEAIKALVRQEYNCKAVALLLKQLTGELLHVLIEATYAVGDPRLCVPLQKALVSNDPVAIRMAADSLAANGDSRCIQPLCEHAASHQFTDVRQAASRTLRRLTGAHSGQGSAWTLWWKNNKVRVEMLYDRDALIASCYEPSWIPNPAQLAPLSVQQLEPLLQAALGSGPDHWQRKAWQIIQTDNAISKRWSNYLVTLYEQESQERKRVAYLSLLSALPYDHLIGRLQQQSDDIRMELALEVSENPKQAVRHSSERAMLALLLER